MKKSLLFIFVACFAISANAQYTFSTFTETYEPIDNSTEIVENDYMENIWDDPMFQVEFGFSFPVGDETFTNVRQDDLGAFLLLSNVTSNTVFTYSSDLVDAELETSFSPSIISYVTDGASGSQICKIQYENCGFFGIIDGLVGGDISNRVNFQFWFYESGIFEMRFGSNSITDNEAAHGGPGPFIFLATDVDFDAEEAEYMALLTDDPENPILDFNPPLQGTITGLADNPSDGRVYRFAPTSLSANDDISINSTKLYPTQADQTIFIDGLESTNEKYQIVDITGKVQLNGTVNLSEGIDVSQLNVGLYLFQIEGFSGALKFVKL